MRVPLSFITLRVFAFCFLIVRALIRFPDSLIGLWAASVFLQIITRRLRFYILRLLTNLTLFRITRVRHKKPPGRVTADR
jgi:hypothetical protein